MHAKLTLYTCTYLSPLNRSPLSGRPCRRRASSERRHDFSLSSANPTLFAWENWETNRSVPSHCLARPVTSDSASVMPPASCRASRLLSLSPTRRYSVRIPGESQLSIKTVADLKAWAPHANVPGVEVCGWVRSVRKSSAVRFVDVTDGSSMRPVQAVVDKKQSTECAIHPLVRFGSLQPEHVAEHAPACESALPFA